ncbi:MAG: DMT(drug/metabolite transporter) superfamily permease [Bacteroidetes bacterium OLB9]|nr:MAG: DMT(drug/metabolite transporter) superfamily permease [Bacteroidetes bacterium OLB9]
MQSLKRLSNISGLIVFLITIVVFYNSVERVGSLWDCGEFVLGAYKLQVVHPPGAGLFLIIGRIFAWVATLISDNPSDIAFAVDMMSAISTSLAAMFVTWITIMFGKLALVGRESDTTTGQNLALAFAGIVAGLSSAFITSVWFSAVEGEVYAMSTMFTMLTLWAATKYYYIEDEDTAYRWLVLSLFACGMSVGVHLLSILTLPAVALLVYYKNYKVHTFKGALVAMALGVLGIIFIMKVVIVGIPTLWQKMELLLVNGFGLPIHSGIVPTILILFALGYYAVRYASKKSSKILQVAAVSAILIVIAFSTVGVVVIRANTDTPINMNVPSDAMRLLPYLNREQYGERPLLSGPHYDAEPKDVKKTDRWGRVGNKYEVVDEKFEYVYDPRDEMLFPRIGHNDSGRQQLHRMWREALNGNSKGKPTMGYNLQFLFHFQINWMYIRYFMWNFVGRQTANQGYYPWDVSKGNWMSGITPIDEARLYKMDKLPDSMKLDESANKYYFLPLIFGLLGLVYHYRKRKKDFFTLLVLFIITGLGIIIYSNQPPNEPRERDYVLVGSFITFCIWMGLGVLGLYELLSKKMKGIAPAAIAGIVVLSAPVIMGFENFDDHSRKHITASRDYATNFLNSLQPNAIIFTYGDNDTYPLWYAQEVEGVRRDVRVVNLSLIAVDWYINKLRSKVNDSPPIKLTLTEEDYRGKNRNQIFFVNPRGENLSTPMNIFEALNNIRDPKYNINGHNFITSRRFYLPIDKEKYSKLGFETMVDSSKWAPFIPFIFPESSGYILKDELAIMDVIASNFYERPIYFAITCQPSKLLGLNDFMEMEGLGLRISPYMDQEPSQLPSIYGFGGIDVDAVYKNVMNKWKWGNFDKMKLYVDQSYLAEVQAMRLIMMRAATKLSKLGDKKRAVEMANKYFEVFPNMNFPYDGSIIQFIKVLIEGGDFESAKNQLRILAKETLQYIVFYEDQTSPDAINSFNTDYEARLRVAKEIVDDSKNVEDPAFEKEIGDMFQPILESQNNPQ